MQIAKKGIEQGPRHKKCEPLKSEPQKGEPKKGEPQNQCSIQVEGGEVEVVAVLSPVEFHELVSKISFQDEQEATANSYQTEQEYNAQQANKQLAEFVAADEQTLKAMQKLLGPKGEANPVLRLITNLLRKPVFKLTEHTRAEYFDFLSHVIDKNPDLVKGVQEICITRNRDANYDENIYQFETVIGELIACSSLRRLTLNQFHAKEIIRILATLKSQTGLQHLNLCDNSLQEHHLSIVVRSLPRSKQPLTLWLDGNELRDGSYIARMVSMHPNVTVGQRKIEPKTRQEGIAEGM